MYFNNILLQDDQPDGVDYSEDEADVRFFVTLYFLTLRAFLKMSRI